MHAIEILDTVQYVVDKEGRKTAVLVDLHHWQTLRHLLEELAEDESLGQLMAAVTDDEKLEEEAAKAVYQAYLKHDPQITQRTGHPRRGVGPYSAKQTASVNLVTSPWIGI